jgi:hypothetical protein
MSVSTAENRRCRKLLPPVRPLAGVLSVIGICTNPPTQRTLLRVRRFPLVAERGGRANQCREGVAPRWNPADFVRRTFSPTKAENGSAPVHNR